MSDTIWKVEVEFRRRVSTYVEADDWPTARRVAEEAAPNMDVDGVVGSDFDEVVVRVGQYPRELRVVAGEDEEAYVWRAGEKWPLCDSAGERLEELSADNESKDAE